MKLKETPPVVFFDRQFSFNVKTLFMSLLFSSYLGYHLPLLGGGGLS